MKFAKQQNIFQLEIKMLKNDVNLLFTSVYNITQIIKNKKSKNVVNQIAKPSPKHNNKIGLKSKSINNLQPYSIFHSARTTIAKLKRTIQQQFHELHGVSLLISVIEDGNGFALSNNSTIGEQVRNNQTLFVLVHRQKLGTNMNLPNNVTDLFMTLRYVCGSVIKKLEQLEVEINPLQVVPEIIHMGFWYSNIETVAVLIRFMNKIFNADSLDRFFKEAHEMQNILLLKLFSFWFAQVRNSFAIFPQVGQELLALMYKLSLNQNYAQLLKNHKIMKNIMQLSKQTLLPPQMKRMAVQIMRNISGKGNNMAKVNSSYIPTALEQSSFGSNIEQVLALITQSSQQMKMQGLQQLSNNSKLISEATVRFDYYIKLTSIFTIRNVKDKASARIFNQVLKHIISNTTRDKAKEIMQKDIIRKIHYFLLDSVVDTHSLVLQYYSFIASESASKGMFNIQQANQFLGSPYAQFLKITVQALAQMSQKQRKISAIRFLPNIKDYVRLSLKTQDLDISANILKVLSNLTLDEQCRYQIINLKGLEIFVKFLQIGQKNNKSQLQRTCAKGLLNLSISSRQVKAKALSLMTGILDRFYKGSLDSIAWSYIQNILKSKGK